MLETTTEPAVIIDEQKIHQTIQSNQHPGIIQVRKTLAKAREMQGLDEKDIAVLMAETSKELLEELYNTAKFVKETIYGKRLVLFAPLYISNFCHNECTYCAFRAKNKNINRCYLDQDQISKEIRTLVQQGHKRVLLVAGEAFPPHQNFEYYLNSIDTIYKTKVNNGEIRRVNVNIAPLSVTEFRLLKQKGIGTYQLFQETYHRETYARVHLAGQKTNYEWRINAMDRAMQASIDDVGIGVLFGLYNWKFEILAMIQHIRHLENKFGVGPHTISVPRIEPASGSDTAANPPYAVSDQDFKKIVAILRLAVPYTGIIMSTRETPQMRRETLELGVSQISAGSRTNPGGYNEDAEDDSQFSLGDHRPLDEVINDITQLGFIPSFCTGCYRLGRTGQDFMDLAKPGEIKNHCDPNALSTFTEYLLDYASDSTRSVGEKLINTILNNMGATAKIRSEKLVNLVKSGKRDVYC